jgi:hypothetical protein
MEGYCRRCALAIVWIDPTEPRIGASTLGNYKENNLV